MEKAIVHLTTGEQIRVGASAPNVKFLIGAHGEEGWAELKREDGTTIYVRVAHIVLVEPAPATG